MPWTRVIRVGLAEECDVRITDFTESPAGTAFRLHWRGKPWARIAWALPGLFNARNAAMAATAAGLALQADSPLELKLDALARFRGVKRRSEVLLSTPGLTVVEDFGHHPTALVETLQSLRVRYPEHVIHAAFEPRSNTSRTKAMQTGFMRALALADEVYLGAVARADKLVAAERFDTEAVAEFLETQGVTTHTAPDNRGLLGALQAGTATRERPHLVVFFTNGSFDGIIADYAREAAAALNKGPVRPAGT
jgi:UDP-N-acetylmuramate: L-alanyl-gamma-D-glutamyl-meso-diaminopimelate ligase